MHVPQFRQIPHHHLCELRRTKGHGEHVIWLYRVSRGELIPAVHVDNAVVIVQANIFEEHLHQLPYAGVGVHLQKDDITHGRLLQEFQAFLALSHHVWRVAFREQALPPVEIGSWARNSPQVWVACSSWCVHVWA